MKTKEKLEKNPPKSSKGVYCRDRIKPPPDRLVRFALQADDKADLKKLKEEIDLCLATQAKKYMPELIKIADSFWEYHQKVGRHPQHGRNSRNKEDYLPRSSKQQPVRPQRAEVPFYLSDTEVKKRLAAAKRKRAPGIPFKLRPFNPNRHKNTPKNFPKLAQYNFLVLTLPLYERTYKRSRCNFRGDLYDVAYILRKRCKLQSVSPDLQYPNFQLYAFSGDNRCPDGTGSSSWHLDNINFDDVPAGINGSGIRIGHPDTGWTPHSELNFSDDGSGPPSSPNIDQNEDINIIDPNAASAEERVPSPPGILRWRYHGTRTGSILVSDAVTGGTLDTTDDEKNDRVRGLAREASVVSIRCVNGVIVIGGLDVADAIMAAVDAGVHVISISLGGYALPVLHYAVQWAVANDIIVVAAAGNEWPFVVYPAAYSACIAAAGSTIDDTVWSGSARNYLGDTPIDISAPAECVQNSSWDEAGVESSNPSSGTSFATAIVAGAAALWLQRFRRDILIMRLRGRVPLQELFRAHLAASAHRPEDWNTALDGPGILNLTGLMNPVVMPLPETLPIPPYVTLSLTLTGPLSPFFDPATDSFTPPPWVRAVFGDQAERIVDNFGEEITNWIQTDPVIATGAQIIQEAVDAARQVAEAAAEGIEDVVEDVEAFVEDVVEDVAEVVEDVIDAAADAASDAVETVAGWFGF